MNSTKAHPNSSGINSFRWVRLPLPQPIWLIVES
jgi:hypothetical protein